MTAVGDGKKTGWAAFRVGHSYLRNFGLAWRTTGRAANGGRLIRQRPPRPQSSLPSDFILAYAPASEGQSLQGREPKFTAIAG